MSSDSSLFSKSQNTKVTKKSKTARGAKSKDNESDTPVNTVPAPKPKQPPVPPGPGGNVGVMGLGFEAGDVQSFIAGGGKIASKGLPSIKKRGILGLVTPNPQSDTGEDITLAPGQSFVSDKEVEKLINIFEKRSKNINLKRLAPGVTQTRLIGR